MPKINIFINTVLGTENLAYGSYISLNEELIRIFISGKIKRNNQLQYVKNTSVITVIFSSLRITEAKRHVRNYRWYYQNLRTKILDKRFGIFCRKPLFDKAKIIHQYKRALHFISRQFCHRPTLRFWLGGLCK
jgi:hypothetical protein